MAAIAPPPINDATGGLTVAVNPDQPVQPMTAPIDPAIAQKAATADAVTSNDPNDAFEHGIQSGNTDLLRSKADQLKGSLAGQAFEEAAGKVDASQKLISDASAIDLSQPNGKKAYVDMVDTFSDRDKARAAGYGTIADNPKLGTALVQFLLGDKAGAVASITGGNVKTYTEFNDDGKMRVVKRNDLGEIDSVYDDVGKLISYEQYRKEGGSRALEHTMARKIDLLNAEKNATAFATNRGNYQTANSVMNAIGERAKRQEALYPMLKSLTPKQLETLASANQAVIGKTSSLARLKSDFDQGGITVGTTIKAEDAKALGIGVDTALTFKGNNTWKDAVDNTYSSATLQNKLNQLTSSSKIDKQFTQTRADLARQMSIHGLSPEGINALDTYFDLEQQNQKDIARFASIIPGFIQLPTSELKVGDTPTRMLLNTLQAQKGAQQMSEFLDFTDKKYEFERSFNNKFTPEPGRYEGAYLSTKANKRLNEEYNAKALGLISKPAPQVEKELSPDNASVGSLSSNQLKDAAIPTYTDMESPTVKTNKANEDRQAATNKTIQNQKNARGTANSQENVNKPDLRGSLNKKFGGK